MAKKINKRDIFLSMIPDNAIRILDVGCSDGSWVSRLGKRHLEVIGLEKDERLYKEACKNLRQVFLTDIEKFIIPYPDGYFDCIMYGDILEHLIDPYTLLKNNKRYLNKDGCIIASIPNVRYYKIILRLVLGGVWDYMDKGGLLDKTHLRFFTLTNIKELFINAGFKIVKIKRNVIAARGYKFLNLLCFNRLKEFFVYQYYIKAIKSENNESLCSNNRKIAEF